MPIPFNLNSLDVVFPKRAAALGAKLIAHYGFGARIPINKMRLSPDPDIRVVANHVHDRFFKNYVRKQYGCDADALSPSLTSRTPITIGRDDRYFSDSFQGLPAQGYTAMFEQMLDHPGITVCTQTKFKEVRQNLPQARIVYTGSVDEYFDYRHGVLPYRSRDFVFRKAGQFWTQPAATISFPNDEPYTRVTELSQMTGQIADVRILLEEYATDHEPGINEPYYPVHSRSTAHACPLSTRRFGAGRVRLVCRPSRDFAYYNMDQACARAMSLYYRHLSAA